MIFSYRTRKLLQRLLTILLTIVVVTVAALACWLLWLQRYIVYTPNGAILDWNLSQEIPQGVLAKPLDKPTRVPIYYGEDDEALKPPVQEDVPLAGFYVTTDDLLADLTAVENKILSLPAGTPVLLDVKSTWGYFFYPTDVGRQTSESFDMAIMGRFFDAVGTAQLYTIARLPAFCDYDFARNNISCGLPVANGALWADENNRYWLDPTDDTVLTYLIQITKELQAMGFDEVVFKDFTIPDSPLIVFDGNRQEAIAKAARTLVTSCASQRFAVSFQVSDPAFPLPEGNCRLYLQNIQAADVSDVLEQVTVPNKTLQVVFLAPNSDTRYDVCGVLRPIAIAR